MMNKYIRGLPVLILIAVILIFSGCSTRREDPIPKVENGVLDLCSWNMENVSTLSLDGNWEFYWNRLVTYDQLSLETPDLYADIPNTWNFYRFKGKYLPGTGNATYRLHVITKFNRNTILGLRFNTFSSAHRIYINENELTSAGVVASDAAKEKGAYLPQTVFFKIPEREFDILIHVSNYEHSRGGFWETAYIGSQKGVLDLQDMMLGKEMAFLGVLLMTSISCFVIYIFRRELTYLLYFSLLCLFMMILIDSLGQNMLSRIWKGIRLDTIIFIWYASIDAVLFFLILLVHTLYNSKLSKIVFRIYSVVIFIFVLVISVTKPLFYTRFARLSIIIMLLGVLLSILSVIVGIKNGIRDGWIHMSCLLIVGITYIHDVLYLSNRTSNSIGEMLYVGLFFGIFFQIILLIRKIKQFNSSLTSSELVYLQAQIKPHFLYNSINTIISISYYDVGRARELLQNFSNYLRRSFDFKEQNQYVPLKHEIELAQAYTEIEKGRFEERLEVNYEVQADLEIKVPILILQPIIENAIIHGVLPKPEGGWVNIFIKQKAKKLAFTVEDNGIGMKKNREDKQVKNKTNSGIGLNNIAKRLKRLYKSTLTIEDNPTGGTIVSWNIPITGKNQRGKYQ